MEEEWELRWRPLVGKEEKQTTLVHDAEEEGRKRKKTTAGKEGLEEGDMGHCRRIGRDVAAGKGVARLKWVRLSGREGSSR